MKNLIGQSFQTNTNSSGLFLLFYRVLIGAFFAISGYNKLFTVSDQNLIRNIFIQADIPFAEYTALFVAAVELGAGILLFIGLLSRLSALALWIISLVALVKVGIHSIPDGINLLTWYSWLLYLPDMLYLMILLVIVAQGCGVLGIDNMIARRAKARRYY